MPHYSPFVDLPAIGARFRALRAACGWSLRAAAERAGISHGYVKMIEDAHPDANVTLEKLQALAGAYGVSVDILVGQAPDAELARLVADLGPDGALLLRVAGALAHADALEKGIIRGVLRGIADEAGARTSSAAAS